MKLLKAMHKFKSLITYIFLLVAFIISSCSEEYLDIDPLDEITPDNFYQDEAQMIQALNAGYSVLGNRGMYGWWHTVTSIVRSDDTETVEGNIIAHHNFNVTDTDIRLFRRSDGNGLWNSIYVGLLRLNLIIVNIDNATFITPGMRERVLGEALFLRSLLNFHLVTLWQGAPLIDESNYQDFDQVGASQEEFWMQIETDLERIVSDDLLPSGYAGGENEELGRATLGATRALLGKAYLYQEKFTEATAEFQAVIDGGEYGLIDVNDVFTVAGDNSMESIFEVQFNNANAGPNPFFDDGIQAAETTLRNQVLAPNQYSGWENAWASQNLVDQFEAGDLRRSAFIVTVGEDFPTRSEAFTGRPRNKGDFAIRKGLNSGFTTGLPDGTGEENFPIIRYADVLLMYAESLIRSNTNLTSAEDRIDEVRARAFGLSVPDLRAQGDGIADYATDNGLTTLEAMKIERRRELCFEGHRFQDLKRWGDALSNSILLDRGLTAETLYYPLSREDLDLSQLLNDN